MFGGVVEDACARAGLKTPTLTAAQRQLPIAKRVIVSGSVIGVIAGCLIGASSLLWLDLEAAERAKRAKELDTIFKVYNITSAILICRNVYPRTSPHPHTTPRTRAHSRTDDDDTRRVIDQIGAVLGVRG